ncbi:cupin [Branchiibius sp. NY16-3462-2]|nr:cupin [Branchiibius sp. NY16-3462-2]
MVNHELAVPQAIPLEPLEADDVVEGSPLAGSVALTTLGDNEVGVWEMTPGVCTDVETDEVFVVLSGSASVRFEDGTTLELHPGSVVRLYDGEHTTWTVRETLRKIYLA